MAENKCSDFKEGFLFGGLSPPNKKYTSLRPQRLRGKNRILHTSDFQSEMPPAEQLLVPEMRKA
jgi:hypothetical protein